MYVDVDAIITIGGLISALGVIVGAIIAGYKIVDSNKHQSVEIKAIKEENTVICFGLKCALQGLIEQGCDGPCKEGLNLLEKHLNKTAHRPEP